MMSEDKKPHIGTLNENHLHAALKEWFADEGDQFEVRVGRYVVDILRADGSCWEIQTRALGKLKGKLKQLTKKRNVRLIYPIAVNKWVVKMDGEKIVSRRRSPKHGTVWDLFNELMRFTTIFELENFELVVVLIQEEEIRRHQPGKAWRRKGWVVEERRLLTVLEERSFKTEEELASLLPTDLPDSFSTADLAKQLGKKRALMQKMVYTLRAMSLIEAIGKEGNGIIYRRVAK